MKRDDHDDVMRAADYAAHDQRPEDKPTRDNLHLRNLKGRWYSEDPLPERWEEFARWALLPLLTIKSNVRSRAEKEQIAIHCLHQLVGTGLSGDCIRDSRNCTIPGVRRRVEVWDAIIAAGLALACIGSESSQHTTRYAATTELLRLKRCWTLYLTTNLASARNSELDEPTRHALVLIHSGRRDLASGKVLSKEMQKQLIPFKSCGAQTDIIKVTEDILEAFNRINFAFGWYVTKTNPTTGCRTSHQVNVGLRQIFAGGWLRAGRFYTFGNVGGQSLPKTLRRKMRVGGKAVAELDLEGSQLRLIYHKHGIDPDPSEDIYQPAKVFPKLYATQNLSDAKKKIVRSFVKTATVICMNETSRGRANSTVGMSLAKTKHCVFLQNAIYAVEGTTPKGIVQRLKKSTRR